MQITTPSHSPRRPRAPWQPLPFSPGPREGLPSRVFIAQGSIRINGRHSWLPLLRPRQADDQACVQTSGFHEEPKEQPKAREAAIQGDRHPHRGSPSAAQGLAPQSVQLVFCFRKPGTWQLVPVHASDPSLRRKALRLHSSGASRRLRLCLPLHMALDPQSCF